MKKSIIISELEKKQIRNQHESYKNFLKEDLKLKNSGLILEYGEPVPTGDALIKKIQEKDANGQPLCTIAVGATEVKDQATNGLALFKTATNQGKMDVAKNAPKYMPGYILIIKSNYTYDVYDGNQYKNNKWIQKGTGYAWKCAALTAQQTADQQAVLNSYKTQGGWQTFDELTDKSGVNDPNKYQTMQVDDGKGNKVTLYKPIGQGYNVGQYAAGTPQAKYLDLIKKYGFTVEPEPGDENAQLVDPPAIGGYVPKTMFPPGFKVYQNLQNLSTETFQAATTALANMTPQKANCLTTLDTYFGYFNGGDNPPIAGSEFQVQQLKTAVEACKRSYLDEWMNDTKTPPKEPGFLAGANKKQEYQTAKENYDKIVNALNIIKLFTRQIATYKQKNAPGRRNTLFTIQ